MEVGDQTLDLVLASIHGCVEVLIMVWRKEIIQHDLDRTPPVPLLHRALCPTRCICTAQRRYAWAMKYGMQKQLSVRKTSGRNNKQQREAPKGSLFKIYVMKMPYINRVRSMFWCLLWVLFVFFLMSKINLLFSFLIESGLVSILLCFWDGFRLCCLGFVFS